MACVRACDRVERDGESERGREIWSQRHRDQRQSETEGQKETAVGRVTETERKKAEQDRNGDGETRCQTHRRGWGGHGVREWY